MALDIVGLAEIANRLGVPRKTVQAWRLYGELPPPEATVSGRPAWQWSTIEKWSDARVARKKAPTR